MIEIYIKKKQINFNIFNTSKNEKLLIYLVNSVLIILKRNNNTSKINLSLKKIEYTKNNE